MLDLTFGAETSDSLSGERFFLLSERLEDDDARRFRDLERELFERRLSFEYLLRLIKGYMKYLMIFLKKEELVKWNPSLRVIFFDKSDLTWTCI